MPDCPAAGKKQHQRENDDNQREDLGDGKHPYKAPVAVAPEKLQHEPANAIEQEIDGQHLSPRGPPTAQHGKQNKKP